MSEPRPPLSTEAFRQEVVINLVDRAFTARGYVSRTLVLYAVETANMLVDALEMDRDQLQFSIEKSSESFDGYAKRPSEV